MDSIVLVFKRLYVSSLLFFSGLTFAGNGVVTGNGSDLLYVEPISPPNYIELNDFLSKLKPIEPTWVSLIQRAFNNDNQVVFLKTKDSCFIAENPNRELRSIFNKESNSILFCKAFYELDKHRQILTFLHELSHFAISKIDSIPKEGEEIIVQQMEFWYSQMLEAHEFSNFKIAVLEFRNLLDRSLKNLILYSSPEQVVPDYDILYILNDKNSRVRYPVPKNIKDENYIPAHFLEYNLNKLWTLNLKFSASELSLVDPKPSSDSFQTDDPIWSKSYLFIDKDILNHELIIKYIKPSKVNKLNPRILEFKPLVIKKSLLNEDFKNLFESNKLGYSEIRTIGFTLHNLSGYLNGECQYDKVYIIKE